MFLLYDDQRKYKKILLNDHYRYWPWTIEFLPSFPSVFCASIFPLCAFDHYMSIHTPTKKAITMVITQFYLQKVIDLWLVLHLRMIANAVLWSPLIMGPRNLVAFKSGCSVHWNTAEDCFMCNSILSWNHGTRLVICSKSLMCHHFLLMCNPKACLSVILG